MVYPISLQEVQEGLSLYLPEPGSVKIVYEQLLDKDPKVAFPFWAKIWTSAIALADFLRTEPEWVIGYLHLVLLGMFSIFLIGQLVIPISHVLSKALLTGIRIFIAGVIINEMALMVQGTAALSYQSIPFINESLLVTALILFTGILLMLLAFRKIKREN